MRKLETIIGAFLLAPVVLVMVPLCAIYLLIARGGDWWGKKLEEWL